MKGFMKHNHGGIAVGVDGIDQMNFFCENCRKPMRVVEVKTRNVIINTQTREEDKCTHIMLKCDACDSGDKWRQHWRKFYWSCDDAQYAANRTDR